MRVNYNGDDALPHHHTPWGVKHAFCVELIALLYNTDTILHTVADRKYSRVVMSIPWSQTKLFVLTLTNLEMNHNQVPWTLAVTGRGE